MAFREVRLTDTFREAFGDVTMNAVPFWAEYMVRSDEAPERLEDERDEPLWPIVSMVMALKTANIATAITAATFPDNIRGEEFQVDIKSFTND